MILSYITEELQKENASLKAKVKRLDHESDILYNAWASAEMKLRTLRAEKEKLSINIRDLECKLEAAQVETVAVIQNVLMFQSSVI